MSSSSSFSIVAAVSADNDRSRVIDPQPPTPPPNGNAVYLHELYREPGPEPLRPYVSRELPFTCRTAVWGTLVFVLISYFVVLMWLIFYPSFPRLHVASATISAASAAAMECNITLLLTNPNRHLTTIYDRMEITLFYPSQQTLLSNAYHLPFVLPKRSRATIGSNFSFNGVDLGNYVGKALMQDVGCGSLSLGIKVLAVVRYEKGEWKSRFHFMRAFCVGLSFAFNYSDKQGLFLNPYQECEVYL